MQRTVDAASLPLADILSRVNDVRWPETSDEVRPEPHGPQEAVDLRDQKKTHKQVGRRVSKQENTQRKAPGWSARCLQGHGDTLRLPLCCFLLTHRLPDIRISCVSVCVCACICHYVRLFVQQYL